MKNFQKGNDFVSGAFRWRIDNFSKLKKGRHYSQVFDIGGFKWRILICQKWKDLNLADQLSIYLCVADASTLPPGWTRSAQFSLTLVNQFDPKKSKTWPIKGSVPQEFNEHMSERGFTSFMPLSELFDRSAGYIANDISIVEAKLDVAIKIEQEGTAISSTMQSTLSDHNVSFVQVPDSSSAPKTPCSELNGDSHADPSLAKLLGEVPYTQTGELMDFRGLGQIEKAFVPLLEEVCSGHPTLVVCVLKRSQIFTECAFTALGRLLNFLKTTKVKDMTQDACDRLQLLWEEAQTFRFDLAWLEPHVESALGKKRFVHRAGRLKRLKEDVEVLESELKRRRTAIAITEVDLAVVKGELEKAEIDLNQIDMDSVVGYGRP